ncbi:MAG TPA: DUF1830 domain-containing protein [Crinalium sp.]|jgi:hypothetical protein
MAQIFDPLPPDCADHLLCCYVNATSKIQIARITNVPNWYFERVVFPGQRLLFEALPDALLEIHSGMMASAILSDTIPCDRLRIQEELENLPVTVEPEFGRNKVVQESLAAVVATSAD